MTRGNHNKLTTEKNSTNFKLGPNQSGQDMTFWHE